MRSFGPSLPSYTFFQVLSEYTDFDDVRAISYQINCTKSWKFYPNNSYWVTNRSENCVWVGPRQVTHPYPPIPRRSVFAIAIRSRYHQAITNDFSSKRRSREHLWKLRYMLNKTSLKISFNVKIDLNNLTKINLNLHHTSSVNRD
jgi:hypothetical protein